MTPQDPWSKGGFGRAATGAPGVSGGAADETSRLWRIASMGTELVAGVAGMALVGYLLDLWLKTSPWALVGGAVAGVLGAGYNFLRRAMREGREAAERFAREHPGGVARKSGVTNSATDATVFPMTAAEQKDRAWESKWDDGGSSGSGEGGGGDGGGAGGDGGGGGGGGGGD